MYIAIGIATMVAVFIFMFCKDKCSYKSQKQKELNEVFDYYERMLFKEEAGIQTFDFSKVSSIGMTSPKTEAGYCFRRYFLEHLKEVMDDGDIRFNSIEAKQAAETAYGSCMTDFGLPE